MRVKGWFVVIGRRRGSDVILFFFQYRLFRIWSGVGGCMHWELRQNILVLILGVGLSWSYGCMHVY